MTIANPIPDRFNTITPYIIVRDAEAAIDFYIRAFDAVEITRMESPDGKIMHAEIRIGNSMLMLADEMPDMGALSPLSLKGSPLAIHLYVDDVDTAFERAIRAGGQETMPVEDMFWGDRYGRLVDPFGHHWSIATHLEDVSAEEMRQRAAMMFSTPTRKTPMERDEIVTETETE